MLVLDTTLKTITANTTSAPVSNQLNYVVAYADNNGTNFTEGAADGTITNSLTTIVTAPAASTRRIIKSINIQNTDTAPATVTIGYANNATTRVLAKVTLNVNDTWTTDATFDQNGQLKYVFGSVNAASQLYNQVPISNGGTGSSTLAGASIVTYNGSETLNNKILTFPAISTINNSGTLTLPIGPTTLVGNNTTDILTNKTLTSPFLTTPIISTITNSGTLTLPTGTDILVANNNTATLTNKRITPRVQPISTNSGTYTLDTNSYDMFVITGQTATIMSITTTGTPTNGQKLWLSITGTAAVGFTLDNSYFESSTVSLPTTTVSTARLDIGFVWNESSTPSGKWRCVAQD
jgi:hypothetical protein